MNILVIGNGFDLAHGLPTKYTDFLEFAKVIEQALSKGRLAGIDWENTNVEVQNLLKTNKGKVQEKLFSNKQTWEELINNNIWIEYFLSIYADRKMNGKDGWIDFESEISEIIQSIDKDMRDFKLENNIQYLSNVFLSEKFCDDSQTVFTYKGKQYYSQKLTYKILRDKLLDDLNRLVRALEVYLTEYVEKIEIRKKSADISELNIDSVLSFNYTHTFSKLYKVSNNLKKKNTYSFDYIHGETSSSNTIETNNMVLGIDEYLSEDRKNKDIDFIAFKKFYQRIYKQTGCEYKKWVKHIQNKYNVYCEHVSHCMSMISDARKKSDYLTASQWDDRMKKYIEKYNIDNVYIFGHSLDVTDKDILRDIILNDNVLITIFYHDKDTMGKQIANLVKVIGQDELIRRTGGKEKSIEFKLQQPMIERKEE